MALPKLETILSIITAVEYMTMYILFFSLDSLCTELAEFYHASASSDSNFGMDQHEDTESNIEDAGDEIEGWKSVMEQIIFPAMKKFLKPPESLSQNKTFHMVADLPSLYRVFERC